MMAGIKVEKNKRRSIRGANNLEIFNFKSIKHIEFDTSRINVFIGTPNSGKSNLIEALTLFNIIQNKSDRAKEGTKIRYNSLDNLFYDRNLSNDIQINFRGNQAFLFYHRGSNGFLQIVNPLPNFLKIKDSIKETFSLAEIQAGVILPKESNGVDFNSQIIPLDQNGSLIASGQIFPLYSENPIRRYEFKDGIAYGDPFGAYLKTSGENLYTIVQGNPQIHEWINSFFDEFKLEFLFDFSSKTFEIQKKERGVVYKIPFELTPDTFRRMLFHIAAIYSNNNATILLEEPESHSFPPYIKELSELIKSDRNNTYFITTHSPYFFNSMVEDSKKISDIAFFHVYYDDYQTKIKKITQKELDNIWGNGSDVFFNIDAFNK
jgi:AAA15 family ATPase/GTPase